MSGVAPWALLIFVACERIAELWLARRNTTRLLAAGAFEVGASHYPIIVAVHALWFAALALWLASGPRTIALDWLLLFAVAQVFRVWVMMSLGRFWTTRIIVVPDAPLVRRGPYRWVKHPNYIIVAVEIFVLPMVFGAWLPAAVFSLANAAILWVRINAEGQALAPRRTIPAAAVSSTAASPTTESPTHPPSTMPR